MFEPDAAELLKAEGNEAPFAAETRKPGLCSLTDAPEKPLKGIIQAT